MRTDRKAKSKIQQDAAPAEPPPRIGEKYPRSLQENVLTALFFLRETGKYIADTIDVRLFEAEYRVLAERAIKYWRDYGKPPRMHGADLVDEYINNPKDPRSKTYQRILLSMQELAETKDGKYVNLNPKYVLDQLERFVQLQRLKLTIIKSAETLDAEGPGAADQVNEILRNHLAGAPASTARVLTTRTADQFEAKTVEWLWDPFIPLGMLTTIVGDGDVGKSTAGIDIAARVSKGLALPQIGNEPPQRMQKGSVLFLCKENDVSRIIRPRLEAAGENLRRVHILGYEEQSDPTLFDPIERLDTTAREMEAIIKQIGDVRYVQIDPITDYVGKIDMYRDDQVRSLLNPIARIAANYNLAVVSILHLNKKTDSPTRYRGMGSIAFRNISQSTVLIAKSQEQSGLRLMLQEKGNLIPEERHHCVAGFHLASAGAYAKVKWESDWQEVDADEVLANKSPTKQSKAAALLRQWLGDGPVAVKELQKLAQKNGISNATLQIAKEGLRVKSKKQGKGKWSWSLPE